MSAAPSSPVAKPGSTSPLARETASVRPLFAVGGLYSRSNGVAWIMRDLAAALGRLGARVDVIAADCLGRGAASIGNIFESPTRWRSGQGHWLGGLSWSPATNRLIRESMSDYDVVHNHSLWMLPNHYASVAARRAGKPVLFTIHGTLEPWALAHSGWKKKLVGQWFQWRDLHAANCLHVNSQQELASVRALGFRQPVAVIPNGVDLVQIDVPGAAETFLGEFPHLRGRKLVLFLARLHRKKGLQHLVEAWRDVSPEFPDWQLVIAGPDCGMESELRRFLAAEQLESRVTLTGALDGILKAGALQAADVFALPSFSEGFSMSVLEGLAAGCPALITPGCNFPEAAAASVAVEVEPTTAGTTAGLRRLLSLSDAERSAMGRAAREFIEQSYTWDAVARQMLDVYRFLLARGPAPACVDFAEGRST